MERSLNDDTCCLKTCQLFQCDYGYKLDRNKETSTAFLSSVCCEPELVDVTSYLGGADDFTTPVTGVKAKCCCIDNRCAITPLSQLMKFGGLVQGGCGELNPPGHSYINRAKNAEGSNTCNIPILQKEEHFGKDKQEH
jgi:hypothetical protein